MIARIAATPTSSKSTKASMSVAGLSPAIGTTAVTDSDKPSETSMSVAGVSPAIGTTAVSAATDSDKPGATATDVSAATDSDKPGATATDVSAATDSDKPGATATDKTTVSITTAMRATLRLEGLLLLVAACVAYFQLGFSGAAFAALFLVPDVSLIGYLRGPRVGAIVYNAGHAMIGPLAIGAIGVVAMPALVPYALIWLAHIGFDRALGYGLKYAGGFQLTHMGRIGRH